MKQIMKNLNEYISECYDKSICYGSRRNAQMNDFTDFFGSNIDDTILEKYIADENFDYVFETLTTHDSDKLMKALEKHFGEYIESFEIYKKDDEHKNSFFAILKSADTYRRFLKYDKKFTNILDFYGYYKSEYNHITKKLFIEPKYTSKVDLSEYHDVCYHFTPMKNVDSILKNGLRCKNQTSRDFPERIYLYATNDKIDKEKLRDFLMETMNSYDIGVLRIDFNRMKSVSVYSDSAMREEQALFTYQSIPAKCISFVKELNL